MDLYQYFVTQSGRNILKNPHYFPIYERHFSRFAGHPITLFEIGTGEGGSSRMWKHYFGPMARIVTIDIQDRSVIEEPQIYVRTGSQADAMFLTSLVKEFGPPDIVLDDGSHLMEHINVSFQTLMPSTKSIYLVEDLDGAYWEERGGGLRNPASFIEVAKSLVDEMNAQDSNGAVTQSNAGKNILSVSFYQMVVVLEKTPYLNREMQRLPEALK